jgi:hypothetical protein
MPKLKRKAAGERPRLSVNSRPLTGAQEQDWRRANDDIASGDFARVKRAIEVLRMLEAALRADHDSVGSGLNDTIAPERGRGEVVEVCGPAAHRSRIRIRSRDGLETLSRSGAIDAAQFRAGMIYRDLYEAADPERDLRSQMNDPDRCGFSRPKAAGGVWRERRLRLAGAMAAVEAKVRVEDRSDCAVRALREVAGHARCISHLSNGGGGQANYRRALSLALDIAVDHFPLR